MSDIKRIVFFLMVILFGVILSVQSVYADAPYGNLVIEWAGTIDNGEGDGWPHGPYGNFRYLIFEPGEAVPQGAFDIYDYGGNGPQVPGDTWTDTKFEWTDGGQRSYSPGHFVHEWRSDDDSIILFIYESDSDCVTVPFWGEICFQRDEDPVFYALVNRQDVINGKMFVSPYPAAEDAVQNAESKADYQEWSSRADVVAALDDAWYSGDLETGRLPKTVVSLITE